MRRFVIWLFIIVLISLPLYYYGAQAFESFKSDPESVYDPFESSDPAPEPEEEAQEPEPDLSSVRIVAVGNIFPHLPQISQARVDDGTYDFSPSFEIIAPFLQSADIAIADLETSQAGPDISFEGSKGYTGWPYFNSPRELSVALRDAGINVVSMANNHAMDRGYDGLISSIDFIRSLGMTVVGAHKSQEERDRPLILEHNGISMALIGYTYSTNGIPVPQGREYAVNYVPNFEDITPVIEDIQSARRAGADLIIVLPHWGEEHAHEPTPQWLRQRAEELAAAGADLIIGGHPKYIQPLEWFFNYDEAGRERATLAVYSRGNFSCNQQEGDGHNSIYNEFGLALDVVVTKNHDSGQVWISDVDYEVTWIHHRWRHRVIPVSWAFNESSDVYNLSEAQLERMKNMQHCSIDRIEQYGYSDGKTRVLYLAEYLYDLAYSGEKAGD